MSVKILNFAVEKQPMKIGCVNTKEIDRVKNLKQK